MPKKLKCYTRQGKSGQYTTCNKDISQNKNLSTNKMPKKTKQAKTIDDEISNLMKKSDEIQLKKEIKNLGKQDDKKDRKFLSQKIKDNAKFVHVSKNPKQSGSKAFTRYEQYKKTKTFTGYFKAGGTRQSLLFDYQRGYIKFNKK